MEVITNAGQRHASILQQGSQPSTARLNVTIPKLRYKHNNINMWIGCVLTQIFCSENKLELRHSSVLNQPWNWERTVKKFINLAQHILLSIVMSQDVFYLIYLFFIIYLFTYLFIYCCIGSSLLHAGFSLVAASGGYSSLRYAGFSLRWLLLLWSTGSRRAGFSSRASRALERRLSSCGARA